MAVNLAPPNAAALHAVGGIDLRVAMAGIKKPGRKDLLVMRLGPRSEVAGVFTQNLQRAMQAFTALDVGGVLINNVPTFRVENMPYGGVKDSGFGREGIRYAMEEMTEVKSLIFKLGQ